MNPREAVVYLESLRRYGVKKGFDRIERLLDALGNPQDDVRTVTVGGTNGKGSVARTLESCLRHDGRSTGLFTSPHMYELGERVRVDGGRMRRRRIADFVERVRPTVKDMIADGDGPTFFETTTAMALDEFSRREVEVAVLEVGMGGRLDTTQVADSDVAAVTSVAVEHADVLGETVEEVAWEVGHVAPEDGVCVVGATGDALETVRGIANDRGTQLRVVNDCVEYGFRGRDRLENVVDVEAERTYEGLRSPLLGEHQARNVAVAVALSEELGISDEAVREGVRRADWPGRFEVVERDPLVVLDVAHNPTATEALVDTLNSFGADEAHVVFGAMADKDVRGMADALEVEGCSVYAVSPSKGRAESAGGVASAFRDAGFDVDVAGPVSGGVESALDDASPEDCVVVTGSLWTVAEARRRWCDYTTVTGRENGVRHSVAALGGADARKAEKPETRTVRLHGLTSDETERLREVASHNDAPLFTTPAVGDMCVNATVTVTRDAYRELLDAGVARAPVDYIFEGHSVGEKGTRVMGILNVTPDSFYDGGEHDAVEDAVGRAKEMVDRGADTVDIGGESTRPGAEPVPVEEELDRVLPVVERVGDETDAAVSVDTRKPEVAREALEAGADMVNDVTGLASPEMRRVVAEAGCRVVVMDSVDVPVDPSREAVYDDVVDDVARRLSERVLRARRAGVNAENIVVDPGIGFGKGSDGDLSLVSRVGELTALGHPVLVGASRKSFLGSLTGRPEEERLEASVTSHALAALDGASYVRVHDVRETVRALEVVEGIRGERS